MERQEGSPVKLCEVIDFQRCVKFCALMDMRWYDVQYTWCNQQRVDRLVYSKLDRVLVNDDWTRIFPEATTRFQTEIFSDHASALVHLARETGPRKSTF